MGMAAGAAASWGRAGAWGAEAAKPLFIAQIRLTKPAVGSLSMSALVVFCKASIALLPCSELAFCRASSASLGDERGSRAI